MLATDFEAVFLLDAPLSIVGLTGLFGYAFRRRSLHPRLWLVWAFLQPVWDLTLNFVLDDPRQHPGGYTAFAILFLLFVPQYVALWRYGYASKDIWGWPTPDRL